MEFIEITIPKWEIYNPRRDLKATTWVRLQNTIFEDPQFFEFTHEELNFWVYILCVASRKQTGSFKIMQAHAERVGRFSPEAIDSALKKLIILGIIEIVEDARDVDVTRTSRGRNVDVTCTSRTPKVTNGVRNTTNERTNVTNEGVEKSETLSATADPHPLARIWNENSGRLAKVKGWNRARQKSADLRWKENPSTEYWTEIVRSIASSPFCLGTNDRSWRADFNWLLQPDVHLKVSEGRYSARRPSQAETFQTPEEFARQEAARLQAELATIRPLNAKGHSDAS